MDAISHPNKFVCDPLIHIPLRGNVQWALPRGGYARHGRGREQDEGTAGIAQNSPPVGGTFFAVARSSADGRWTRDESYRRGNENAAHNLSMAHGVLIEIAVYAVTVAAASRIAFFFA